MGFKLAIVPGLLLKAAIGACDAALAALKETHIHPAPRDGMTVRAAFNRVGADGMGCVPHEVPRRRKQSRAAE